MQRKAKNPVRETKMLDAALALFSRIGFRATTMEQIALEAGFSKATVYAYFADKEDIFRAVGTRFAADIVATVEAGLATEGTVSDRVRAALQAKDAMIYELVRSSPHAAELFAAKHELIAETFEETDTRVQKAIRGALTDSKLDGVSAVRLARILVRASRGLAAGADSTKSLRADIAVLVAGLVGD